MVVPLLRTLDGKPGGILEDRIGLIGAGPSSSLDDDRSLDGDRADLLAAASTTGERERVLSLARLCRSGDDADDADDAGGTGVGVLLECMVSIGLRNSIEPWCSMSSAIL